MPRKQHPWFRVYVEMFPDRKIRRLTPTQRWLWTAIMGAAAESPERGRLLVAEGLPMTRRELADYADVKEREVGPALTLMQQLGMVLVEPDGVITVPNFTKRQFESDVSTERTRRHRSNQSAGNDVGTFQSRSTQRSRNGHGNAPETETETETETDLGTAERDGGGGVEAREPPPPDTPPCTRHPRGTSAACADCRNHRLATEARQGGRAAETAAAQLAAQLAIDNCGRCDDTGWITIERPGQADAVRRCDHQPQARTA